MFQAVNHYGPLGATACITNVNKTFYFFNFMILNGLEKVIENKGY